MESKREQAFVGTFVIVAIAILLFTLFYISGTFRSSGNLYIAPISKMPAGFRKVRRCVTLAALPLAVSSASSPTLRIRRR